MEGLFPVSREFLDSKNAKPFNIIWDKLIYWILKRSYNGTIIFISHNNFCSDKRVLEHHFNIYNCYVPNNLYFFDSLIYFRDNIKTHDYSLKGLVRLILNKEHENAHRAETDTIRLYECLRGLNLTGYVFCVYYNSLRTIYGIGATIENLFMQNNIFCEEQLIQAFASNQNHLNWFMYNLFANTNIKKRCIDTVQTSIVNRLYGVQ